MYQLHVQVQEFPTVHRVHFVFSVVDEAGRARTFGSHEQWIETADVSEDALYVCLLALRRAVQVELRPNR